MASILRRHEQHLESRERPECQRWRLCRGGQQLPRFRHERRRAAFPCFRPTRRESLFPACGLSRWQFRGVCSIRPIGSSGDGSFYGTSLAGGFYGDGAIFKLTTNGNLSSLFSFNGNNGAIPYAGLCLGTDRNFYGAAYTGGAYGDGATFRLIGRRCEHADHLQWR